MKKCFLFIMMSFSLAACSPEIQISSTRVPSETQAGVDLQATMEINQTQNAIYDSTQNYSVHATQTYLAELALTPSPTATITEIDPPVTCKPLSTVPDGLLIDEYLIFYDVTLQDYYSIGGEQLNTYRLPSPVGKHVWLIGVSDNNEWLAYSVSYENDPSEIYLISLSGQKIRYKISAQDIYSILGELESYEYHGPFRGEWINSELILVWVITPYPEQDPERYPILFNPFEQTSSMDLILDLPNRNIEGGIAFSPDLDKVAYVSLDESFILWDLDRKENVIEYSEKVSRGILEGNRFGGNYMDWSEDGSSFAFTAPENPFAGNNSRTGQIGAYILSEDQNTFRRISSYLGRHYDSFSVRNLSWSSDGSLLAVAVDFYNVDIDNNDYEWVSEIHIYDKLQENIVITCEIYGGIFDEIHWSSNNRFVAFNLDRGNRNDFKSPLMVLDIESGNLYELVENIGYNLGGWSENLFLSGED